MKTEHPDRKMHAVFKMFAARTRNTYCARFDMLRVQRHIKCNAQLHHSRSHFEKCMVYVAPCSEKNRNADASHFASLSLKARREDEPETEPTDLIFFFDVSLVFLGHRAWLPPKKTTSRSPARKTGDDRRGKRGSQSIQTNRQVCPTAVLLSWSRQHAHSMIASRFFCFVDVMHVMDCKEVASFVFGSLIDTLLKGDRSGANAVNAAMWRWCSARPGTERH